MTDAVPIDVSRFTPEQVGKISQFISDNGFIVGAHPVGR